jgi:hypothetical protein
MLVPQAAIELRGGVPLLAWGLLILGQDLLNPPLVRAEPRRRSILL